MIRFAPFLILLAACGPSEDKFVDKFTELTCDKYEECDSEAGIFFEDRETCELFLALGLGAISGAEDCDYNRKAAKECLAAVEDASCNKLNGEIDACIDVWEGDCDGLFGTSDTGG